MRTRGAALLVSVAALLAASFASHVTPALADGDPGSDVLVYQPLFVNGDAGVSLSEQSRLGALLQASARAGFPIRVAIIATPQDLGAVTALWRKPQAYAHFLGIELSLTYSGRLLIVMPNGFGFDWPAHSAAAYRTLGHIPIHTAAGGLATAAQTAVGSLAAVAGVRLRGASEQQRQQQQSAAPDSRALSATARSPGSSGCRVSRPSTREASSHRVAALGWPSTSELIAKVRQALAYVAGPPASLAAAEAKLVGSPPALGAIHRQADQLLGGEPALAARIRGLRGYPIVINAWASWCWPCQSEFRLFQGASARFGRQVAFLGADSGDSAGAASSFLAQHPVSYPSYQMAIPDLTGIIPQGVAGLPTTTFIDRRGKLVYVHAGQYDTAGSLDGDIETYALQG
jgi:cytochrome c biogenesis protein CcmG/thiol:disulfide interchange protein DsbE